MLFQRYVNLFSNSPLSERRFSFSQCPPSATATGRSEGPAATCTPQIVGGFRCRLPRDVSQPFVATGAPSPSSSTSPTVPIAAKAACRVATSRR